MLSSKVRRLRSGVIESFTTKAREDIQMKTAKGNEENQSAWESTAPSPTQGPNTRNLLVVGIAVVLAGIVTLLYLRASVTVKTSAAAPAPTASSAAAEPVLVEFEKLKGKWLRPDGGYVLEIKKLLPENALEAAYYNPNPIHVGKAKLYKERGFVKVFVELQDVNYPGSTYTLIYDKENDQLCGVYYQATQQQEYQIAFERMPPGS